MSNPLAIAAVTATLRNLLFQGVSGVLAGTQVTARPPDRARADITGNQLNVFLYRTSIDAAWRNQPLPTQAQPLEDGNPPLPLTLHYLLTAYADGDDEVVGNQIIGRAMSVLHDRPVLEPAAIQTAVPGNDLHLQFERVRLTNAHLTEDELFRLWTAFQTEYRLAVIYEASVVLIESTRPAGAALPVLQHGPNNRGPVSQADTESPFPALVGAETPDQRPVILPGDELRLLGTRLTGASASVRFGHRLLASPVTVGPAGLVSASDTEVRVNVPAGLPAGFVTVAVLVTDAGGEVMASNELALALAPAVANAPVAATRDGAGVAPINLDCVPDVLPEQDVWLILGARQVHAGPRAAPASTLAFAVPIDVGTYRLRLRVDGVDSVLIDYAATPPAFRADQRVDVT